jgi:ribose transport system substrate-binding protein
MSGDNRQVKRRRFLTLAGAASTVALAGCGGDGGDGGSDGGDGGNDGDGGGSDGSDGGDGGSSSDGSGGWPDSMERIGYTSYVRGGAWITAYVESGRFYAEDQAIEMDVRPNQQEASKQVQDIRDFTNKGFDGIIVGVWQTGAAADAIQAALDENIPVIATNADTANENIPMYVGFGNYEGGAKCAEEMYSALQNQKPDQSPWQVLNVRGIQGNQSANQRSQGFLDVMSEKSDVEVLDTINGEYARDVALNKTQQWINNNQVPHGIYSGNLTMGLGVRTALDNLDMLYEKGTDDHIVLTQMDGGPEANQVIANGFIDAAVDQPNYFYNPIAIKYMMQIAENGIDSLPEVGSEVTSDDLTIEPAQHKGVEMWSNPIWAPAQMDEQNGHPWFKTNNIVITQENADEPYLWGNVWGGE